MMREAQQAEPNRPLQIQCTSNSSSLGRRDFLKAAAMAGGAALLNPGSRIASGQDAGMRPEQSTDVEILNPCGRVPMSMIIDDSTCLVNLAHFGIPQFAEIFPDGTTSRTGGSCRARSPTPSSASSAQWCHEHGVKGKYSIVPYPACVGWLDRVLPGWSQRELDDSLALVRDADDARLGHPPRDGQPHPGDRHEDGPALPRGDASTSWRTGGGRTASRSTSWPTTWATPCASSRTRACRARGSPRRAGSATVCCPSCRRRRWKPVATCSARRSPTTSAICSPTTAASLLASSTLPALTDPTRSASSRSSAARATGSGAGTA